MIALVDGLVILAAVFVVPAFAVLGAYAGYRISTRIFGPIVVLTIRNGVLHGAASVPPENGKGAAA